MLNSINRKSLFLSIALFVVAPHLALAEGGDRGAGNGGDTRCAEYSDFVGRIASTLVTIGQEEVKKVNAVIKVDELWQIKRQMKCLPVDKLDRQARSYPADKHTDLLVSAWDRLNPPEKVRLAAHELAVLAQYENDGEYFISTSIVDLIESKTSYFKNLTRARQVINNADGTVTFVDPMIYVNGYPYSFGIEVNRNNRFPNDYNSSGLSRGVCRFFGYATFTDYNMASGSSEDGLLYAGMTETGYLEGPWKKNDNVKKPGGLFSDPEMVAEYAVTYLKTVTCKQ